MNKVDVAVKHPKSNVAKTEIWEAWLWYDSQEGHWCPSGDYFHTEKEVDDDVKRYHQDKIVRIIHFTLE